MKATVSGKGRVTIPKPLRARLGISPGAVLDFYTEGDRLVARKAQTSDPTTWAWGILKLPEPVDAFLEGSRDRR